MSTSDKGLISDGCLVSNNITLSECCKNEGTKLKLSYSIINYPCTIFSIPVVIPVSYYIDKMV